VIEISLITTKLLYNCAHARYQTKLSKQNLSRLHSR